MADPSFRDFVLDQLGDSVEVVCRPMFGGHGLYARDAFFAIIFKGRLYFRTNESSRSAYVREEMKPFHRGLANRAMKWTPDRVDRDEYSVQRGRPTQLDRDLLASGL